MLSPRKREISFHDLVLEPSPSWADLITLEKLLPLWIKRIENGDSVYEMDEKTAALRIRDHKLNSEENKLLLLVQLTDKNVMDPAFSDLETGEIRVEPKLEGEGIAVAGHILIDLNLVEKENVSYLLLVEKVAGVSRTRLDRFITHELRVICEENDFQQDSPKSGNPVKVRPLPRIDSHMSTRLRELVERRQLTDLSFVTREVVDDNLDQDAYVHERTVDYRYQLAKYWEPDEIWSNVLDWFRLARQRGAKDIRIKYRDESSGRKRSSKAELNTETISDISFTKTSEIKVLEDIAQCEEKIRDDIIERMIRLANGVSR